jgi:predicted deacylase
MAGKRIIKLPVEDKHHGVRTFIPVGIAEGHKAGPTLAVLSGVHATEYVAQDGATRFWESLNPAELSGRVLVVLAADVTALCAHHMYTNPVDGKNLNRIFPGKPDGTLTEVIADTIMREVILKSDAMIDCHGGEFDEFMALYLIVPLKGDPDQDTRTMDLAMALGIPFVEVSNANSTWLGRGTSPGETALTGRPAVVIEAGERGFRDERAISAVYNALQNALKHLGIKEGKPVHWAGTPVRLARGEIVRAPVAGLFVPRVVVGEWIEEGALFAEVHEFGGRTLLGEIRAAAAGTVLTVLAARGINADGFAGKIGVVS